MLALGSVRHLWIWDRQQAPRDHSLRDTLRFKVLCACVLCGNWKKHSWGVIWLSGIHCECRSGRGSSSRVSLLHGSSSRRRIDAPPVLATSEREAEITSVEGVVSFFALLLHVSLTTVLNSLGFRVWFRLCRLVTHHFDCLWGLKANDETDDPRRWLLLLSPMSSGWSLWLLSFGFLQLYEATGHADVLGFWQYLALPWQRKVGKKPFGLFNETMEKLKCLVGNWGMNFDAAFGTGRACRWEPFFFLWWVSTNSKHEEGKSATGWAPHGCWCTPS
jgi:hypothetical protein